eukprot:CAMPEP_0201282370 /NCGR_PEP_ID=MMETSP1317-20130820/5462_1 /ASSEMBLY_ACC=CAM_ASM_000770 /TAXON_ID=187299 /ORGANISM="Undescribed Undescribed, Strain Undescribed" /LENGTH=68 /DNA_ID=CAMNT_0047594809 /DNA_START=259 /DNA_END=465 /DNA_ORIENTATION=+
MPNGHALLVNEKVGPSGIPKGNYDTGDGYFDPKTLKIYNYDGTFLRDPTKKEMMQITEKYRYNPTGEI